MIEAGTIIDGRYEVLRRVGSGGMADVYLAADQLLGRQVAVKMLHHRFAEDQEFVERFRREASSAAGLSHPNVVSVFDRGEWDGTYYIAMEYLPGRTLKSIVREQGPLAPAAAIDVVVQVLRAARFAHRRGVIHRDLKPHNVILDEEGRAKVTDFGIARAGASDMTLTGSIMGTAQYLSPEQAEGKAVSERSDIYSIGVVLYELLTGRVPFEGETAVTIALQHISRSPAPPSELNGAVPQALDAVVLRMLEKDPSARYGSADEAIAALEQVRSTMPDPRGEHALTSAAAAIAGAGVLATAPTAAAGTLPLDGPWLAPAGQMAAYDPGAGGGPAAGVLPVSNAAGIAGNGASSSPDQDPNRPRRLLWFAALIPLAIAAILIVLLLSPDRVRVPALEGQPVTLAVARLKHLGLRVNRSEAASSTVPAGDVVSTRPSKGTLVKPHAIVALLVSTGRGTAIVPKVAGESEREALKQLDGAGLKPKIDYRGSETFRSGLAIGTSPAAGTSRPVGSNITLHVSSGPPQVQVPKLTGLSRVSAEELLEEKGLTVGAVKPRRLKGVSPGTVVGSSPRRGQQVSTGTKVTLFVAEGLSTPSVVVPSVIEDSRESALATLRAAGLKPEVVPASVPASSPVGYVIRQDPSAGSHVRKDSAVKVYVGVEQESTTTSSTTASSQTSSQTTSTTTSTTNAQAGG